MTTDSKHKDALLTLQKAGISKTSQRLAVLDILKTATKPLSANAIRQSLESKVNVDKVTVYRILSLFRQHGIIREIASAGGVGYFEMATQNKHVHPHFNCRNCGTLSCMEPQHFIKIPDLTLSKGYYSIEHIEINVSGICALCRDTVELKSLKRSDTGK